MQTLKNIPNLRDRLYQQNLDYLLSLPKFGHGLGLYRMSEMLAKIPNSHAWDAVKITGSNGKGSVVAMLSAIFRELGLVHGTYTSPHLIRFNERIAVSGVDIGNRPLAEAINWVKRVVADYEKQRPGDTFGAFEIFTGIALHYFSTRNLKHLILEAGIGGRYDSIRPVPGGLVALTSLDLEHTALLGNTLEEIAYDKMDLCPFGGTLVIGRLDDELPLMQVRSYAALRGIRLLEVAEACRAEEVSYHQAHTSLNISVGDWFFPDLTLNLLGPHQVKNAQLAILLTIEYLARRGLTFTRSFCVDAVRRGLAAVTWLGRAQKVHDNPPIYLDVGHTPKAVDAFLQALPGLIGEEPVLLVTGVSHNKEVESIVGQLVPIARQVICTRAYHMGSEIARIEEAVLSANPAIPYVTAETIEGAAQLAVRMAREQMMTVVVAGGLFLSIEFLMALEGHDPKLLRFF